ncbi:MAG TPA: hypothetical protein VM118_14290, partial [Acidobacteriota bacterium]|nr:hypothetical protein [Acidobacteriota bacterium]
MTNAGVVSVVDLTCTDCVNATEIEDLYLLIAGDTSSAGYTLTGDWDFSGGGIEIENGTTPPSCTEGQLYLDTDATAGQQLMACDGGTFVVQGDGGASGGDDITAQSAFGDPVNPIFNDTATVGVTATDAAPDTVTWDFLPAGVDGPTWGDGTSSTWVFDVGATDPSLAFTSDTITITQAATLTASTTNADFGAVTATSYGGIVEANLVDKSAAEAISGAWDWTDTGTFDFGGPVTGTSFTADASATPSFTLTDSTNTGQTAITMSDDANFDAIMNLQVDIAGTLTTFAQLDGAAETVILDKPLYIKEQADASADVAAYGQIWINTAVPNELWFTDDAGTDVQLGTGGVHTATAITDGLIVEA